jgi:hypothetical protein
MEVYWIEVEYKPQSGCSQTKEPGVVYVFVKSKDAITAHYAVKEALNQQKLDADKWLLIEPYDLDTEWDSDELRDRFMELYQKADSSPANVCFFDEFCEKEEYDDWVYLLSVEYAYSPGTSSMEGGFVYVFVKSHDALSAYLSVSKELKRDGRVPICWEFIKPYDEDTQWENEEHNVHYLGLYNIATTSNECVFDVFYDYEKL